MSFSLFVSLFSLSKCVLCCMFFCNTPLLFSFLSVSVSSFLCLYGMECFVCPSFPVFPLFGPGFLVSLFFFSSRLLSSFVSSLVSSRTCTSNKPQCSISIVSRFLCLPFHARTFFIAFTFFSCFLGASQFSASRSSPTFWAVVCGRFVAPAYRTFDFFALFKLKTYEFLTTQKERDEAVGNRADRERQRQTRTVIWDKSGGTNREREGTDGWRHAMNE